MIRHAYAVRGTGIQASTMRNYRDSTAPESTDVKRYRVKWSLKPVIRNSFWKPFFTDTPGELVTEKKIGTTVRGSEKRFASYTLLVAMEEKKNTCPVSLFSVWPAVRQYRKSLFFLHGKVCETENPLKVKYM